MNESQLPRFGTSADRFPFNRMPIVETCSPQATKQALRPSSRPLCLWKFFSIYDSCCQNDKGSSFLFGCQIVIIYFAQNTSHTSSYSNVSQDEQDSKALMKHL